MFEELHEKLHAKAELLSSRGYAGHHESVYEIVHEARELLEKAMGKLGPWETSELDYAEQSIRQNFLVLALTAVQKALDVSQLPADEYDYGFNYAKKQS